MARIRQLKPSFFLDEDIAELTPWARLLFQGLWTLADREGRLEEHLGPIRVQVFPYDNLESSGVSMASMLDELARPRKHSDGSFITRYTVGKARYIQIHGFTKHQKCHPRESPSEIPALSGDSLKAVPNHGQPLQIPASKPESESESESDTESESDSQRCNSQSENPDHDPAYADEVWTAFLAKSELPATRPISAKEYATLRKWLDDKIPLRIVLRGIADTRGKGRLLGYFESSVQEAYSQWRKAIPP